MQRKTKAIITIASAIIVAMLSAVTSIAVTINGKSFSNYGGDYYNNFGYGHISDEAFYNLDYNRYRNTYFGANTKNDYRDYVAHSRDGYCLNEHVGTGSGRFYVANIIDIEGNRVTFAKSGTSYYATTPAQKKALANMAYAIYARSNGVGSNTGWRQWMDNNGGWRNFYNTFASDIDDWGLRGNIGNGSMSTVNSDYENLLQNVTAISDNGGTDPIAKTGSWKVGSTEFKTRMGPYNLNLNELNGMTTSVICEAEGTYTGTAIKENDGYYLYLTDKIKVAPTKITVKQSYKAYKARLILIGTGDQQARLIGRGKVQDVEMELDITDMPKFETDVSLQKYIVKVTSKNDEFEAKEKQYDDRKNTYSASDEANERAKKASALKEEGNMKANTFKRNNVVQIEAGDTVTYRIHVYNNSDVNADEVVVKDQLLYYGDTQYEEYNIVSITRDGNGTDIKGDWKKVVNSKLDQYQYTITNLGPHAETYFDVSVELKTYLPTTVIDNTAWIDSTNPSNKDTYRTVDRDYVEMKAYKVSLQKIVESVNGKSEGISNFDRWTSWESKANIANKAENTYRKHSEPVTVANGDIVTYAIKLRNDGDTVVKSLTIKETLPEGVSAYSWGEYSADKEYAAVPADRVVEAKLNKALLPGSEAIVCICVKVSEPNISTRVLVNNAEIKNDEIINKNDVTCTDTTPDDNQDKDYIQLKDIEIGGFVWNDKSVDKNAEKYNGLYDPEKEKGAENKLANISVHLYRDGVGIIASTVTDKNGNYRFNASMIDAGKVTHECERHIKAPYMCKDQYTSAAHSAKYWKDNAYYAYYIVFDYDGITYTSTVKGAIDADNYKVNSNAAEDNGKVSIKRTEFNNRFNKVNNRSGITYKTNHPAPAADGTRYLPESIHQYNAKTMMIQASTDKIQLANDANLQEHIGYINLGLRGREVFDLELHSDVYRTKVSVNGQEGVYNYNDNKVYIQKADIAVREDMANLRPEYYQDKLESVQQTIRDTDLGEEDKLKELTHSNYTNARLGVEVTYKLTINNGSQTPGTATQVMDYYDDRYTLVGVQTADGTPLTFDTNQQGGDGYKAVLITTPGTILKESETMEIYVIFTLNNPTETLKPLLADTNKIPTYNMAEVYEYTTQKGANQTEYTRGLLDKDSAPGSANIEQVRLTDDEGKETPTVNGNPTTVQYYFTRHNGIKAANDLTKLKYEDDTYACPTLYFAVDGQGRTLSGVVFRDTTKVDGTTRIKTGDGVKADNEVGVAGATVELIEMVDGNEVTRYTTSTGSEGVYTFEDFLPGNYMIRYQYGNTRETVLLGDINKYSYNGEDYQSTNNTGSHGAAKLNNVADVWYAYNEKDKVSTGTDNVDRRKQVSETVTDYDDTKMAVLNNARNGRNVSDDELSTLITDTKMHADTPRFTLSVEKTETNGDNQNPTQKDAFGAYNVQNMNFGIAEVPKTTITLNKQIQSFKVVDTSGENVLASWDRNQTQGNVLKMNDGYDVQIENNALQGAKLDVIFNITSVLDVEKNFDGNENTNITIAGLVDYIDNDLSFNPDLSIGNGLKNSDYWEVTSYADAQAVFHSAVAKDDASAKYGTVDPEGTFHTTLVKAKDGNPLLTTKTGDTAAIALEKTLSAEETTIGNIISSTISTYEYDNHVEISRLNYENTKTRAAGDFEFRDRYVTPNNSNNDQYIRLAGIKHDNTGSDRITIHPPTGDGVSSAYYATAIAALAILAGGVVAIKKYAIK